jgi:hypothetical protein
VRKNKRRKERDGIFWVQNICKKRIIHGEFHSLYPDLLEDDAKMFGVFSDELWRVYGTLLKVIIYL